MFLIKSDQLRGKNNKGQQTKARQTSEGIAQDQRNREGGWKQDAEGRAEEEDEVGGGRGVKRGGRKDIKSLCRAQTELTGNEIEARKIPGPKTPEVMYNTESGWRRMLKALDHRCA